MDNNLKYWVALNLVLAENLNAAKKIFHRFPKIEEVFESSQRELQSLGLDEENAHQITSSKVLDLASREIEWINKKDYSILTLEDERYPKILREIFDPPFVLYCAGRIEVLQELSVAIVGARKPTPYGKAIAERLAKDLASRGLIIVSGMARGVDSLSHWGALKGGKTVAVLGSGLDFVYPKENLSLFNKIKENGVVVTEYSRKSPPLGFHFPLRNRIIAGISHTLIVVEATKKSGSLISARLALEENRDVMAVPGNVTSDLSHGTNWLIKNGAKLVEGWKDVIEEMPLPFKEKLLIPEEGEKMEFSELKEPEKKIYEILHSDSLIHIDELIEKSHYSVSEVLAILLSLEIKGFVLQSPGKFYQRKL